MSYTLTQTAASIFAITSGRAKVGSVFQRASDKQWVGKIGTDIVIAASPDAAFREIVKVQNRVALCGVNDEQKAREALAARNAEARRNADEFNALMRDAGLTKYGVGVSVRRRKIAI